MRPRLRSLAAAPHSSAASRVQLAARRRAQCTSTMSYQYGPFGPYSAMLIVGLRPAVGPPLARGEGDSWVVPGRTSM